MKGLLKKYSVFFGMLFRVSDPAIVFAGSYIFYARGWLAPGELAKILAIYCGILVIIIFPLFDLYKSWRTETIGNEIRGIAGAWIIVLLLFNILMLLTANVEQRAVLWPFGLFKVKAFCIWSIAVFSGIICERFMVRLFLRLVRKNGWNQRHVVIAGAGEVGRNLAGYLLEADSLGIKVDGFFDDRTGKGDVIDIGGNRKLPVIGNIKESIEYSVTHDLDIVFIALPMRADKKINELIWGLGLSGINVMMAPDLFAFGLQKAKVIHIGETPVMLFNLFPIWKRVFDVVFSFLALIVMSPIMLLIGFLIKQEDGGSVFYGHKRVREQGKIFKCLKFRTMYMNADKKLKELLAQDPVSAMEWEKSYKLKKDPRITKIGKFLRKTSLDELPQFINVLKGEMSIVGARPVVKDELDKYYNSHSITYCSMKPGLTGLWQAGKRNDVEDYDERVRQDRLYIVHANIWLDLKIIFKTVWKMISGKGAY